MADTTASEFEKIVRVNNKDFFIDLKTNELGRYVKISERRNGNRNTILIPAEGLASVIDALNDAMDVVTGGKLEAVAGAAAKESIPANDKAVFVTGFPKDTAESDVVAFMSTAGKIFSAELKGKGKFASAIVEYTTAIAATKAVDQFNETTYLGQKISCRADRGRAAGSAAPKAPPAEPTAPAGKKKKRSAESRAEEAGEQLKIADEFKVFCMNLSFDTTDEELNAHFSAVGEITSAAIKTNRKGRSTGSAVIEFADAKSVSEAIAQLNGVSLQGRDIRVREYFTN